MFYFQNPAFKARVESDIAGEKRRRTELQKRERQLKAQIENLIADSLGLLRCRLGELGIQARNSPEFIEKAKGIVCSHHDLQRKKAGVEAEIRTLEAETDKFRRAKEAELQEKMARERPGMPHGQIKDIVRRELDHIMSSGAAAAMPPQSPSSQHQSSPPAAGGAGTSVAPLLNKLSDVTFT